MKITFIQKDMYDYIGTMYLIAYLKSHGHYCKLIIENSDKKIISEFKKEPTDIVGFSCMVGATYNEAINLAKKVKENKNVIVVLGGPYPTMFPEVIEEPDVDVICRGEGYEAIVEFANKLQSREDYTNINNLWFKFDGNKIIKNDIRNLVDNLDKLLFPDRSLHYRYVSLRNQFRKNFIISRGCLRNCSYCYNPSIKRIYSVKGRYYRYRSPESIVEEIKEVKDKYGMKYIGFMDDTMVVDLEWLDEFSKMYKKEINLPFITAIIPDYINSETLHRLKEAGCDTLAVGLETSDEKIRSGPLNRPGFNNDRLLEIFYMIKKYGIKLLIFNMIGSPGETAEDVWETINMNIFAKADFSRYTILTPSTGTDIALYSVKEGLCSEKDVKLFAGSYLRRSILKQKGIRKLEKIQKVAYFTTKFPIFKPICKVMVTFCPTIILEIIYLLTNGYLFLKINKWSIIDIFRYGKNILRWYEG